MNKKVRGLNIFLVSEEFLSEIKNDKSTNNNRKICSFHMKNFIQLFDNK